MSSKKILVLSPHLDDAILSCAAHILEWKKKNNAIHVVTVFTKFLPPISEYAKGYMYKSGFNSSFEFEKHRKIEDINAMQNLGVTWEYLDYVDAGFRRLDKKQSLYSQTQIFTNQVKSADQKLLGSLSKKLSKFNIYDKIVVPLGIGNHIDHLLTKAAAKSSFASHQLIFYVDFPYALHWQNWKLKYLKQLVFGRPSFRMMNLNKLDLLRHYKSQMKLLFSKSPTYMEVLLKNTVKQ